MIDIYAPESVNINQVDDEHGMMILARALKGCAMNLTPLDQRTTYLEENEDYGKDVIRISDVESVNCWYGYIYTRNESPYRLQETVRPSLNGLEVVWPPLPPGEEDIEIDVAAGSDHVIILRRTAPSCQYGLSYLTHPRELDDDEMIQIAKLMDESNPFGKSKAFYKLYNTAKGAVFYFENGEKDKTFSCEFHVTLDNLKIEGEAAGATNFKLELKPGQSGHKMLKPVAEGEETGIEMRFDFKFS